MQAIVLQKNKENSINLGFFKRFVTLAKAVKKQTVIIYIVFFVVSLMLISYFSKDVLHLTLNSYNSPFFDWFFKYSTFLGDGILFGVLFLTFLFFKRKVAYAFAVSGILTLAVIALLKKVIFAGMARPAQYLGIENLHLVKGVEMAFWNTFPSGHTTTAFAIFTILCLCFTKCKSQYVWVSMAIIAGISRVYLSQHFWVDIFVGSLIGIVIGFVSMALFYKPKKKVH